jgi:hypothetical protein
LFSTCAGRKSEIKKIITKVSEKRRFILIPDKMLIIIYGDFLY